MKMETYDDLEYSLSSPFWRGRGNRLWTPESEENKEEFINEVCETPIGKEFCSMFDSESITPAWDKVIAIHQSRSNIYGNEITFDSFVRCLTDAINSGAIQTPPPPQPKARELTAAQKKWQECAEFFYGDTAKGIKPASRIQVDERKKVDPVFAAYVRKTTQSEWDAVISTGGAVDLSSTPTVDSDEVSEPTAELHRFVEAYNHTSVADLKPRGGYVYVGGQKLPLNKFLRMQEWAANSHLI
jgi:hypothetical protein